MTHPKVSSITNKYVHKPYAVEISVGGRSENIGVHVVTRTPDTSHSDEKDFSHP